MSLMCAAGPFQPNMADHYLALTLGLSLMAAVGVMKHKPPPNQVSFAYGYETTVVLAWDPASASLRRLQLLKWDQWRAYAMLLIGLAITEEGSEQVLAITERGYGIIGMAPPSSEASRPCRSCNGYSKPPPAAYILLPRTNVMNVCNCKPVA